jgi:hypothetical protein
MKLYFEKKNIVYTPNIDWKIHMGSQVFAFILWKRLHTGNAHLSWLESQAILILMGCLFLKSSFRKITFQTFLCLFAIRKVGQWKILSGQRKTLSSQRKIWFGFQENVFLLF